MVSFGILLLITRLFDRKITEETCFLSRHRLVQSYNLFSVIGAVFGGGNDVVELTDANFDKVVRFL